MTPGEHIRSYLTRRTLAYAGVAIAVIVAGWFFFIRDGSGIETLTLARGEFLEQVSVSGTVVAAQNVGLGWSAGGRVSRVYAQVGDEVARGAVLAEVENGDLRANLLQKQAALKTQEAKLASLKEGTRPEEIAVTEAAIAADKLTLTEANEAVVNAIRDAYTTSDDAVRNQVDQFMSNPRSINPQLNFQTYDTSLSNRVASGRLAAEQLLTQWQKESAALSASGDLDAASAAARANIASIASFLSDASAALNRAIPNASATQSNINSYIADVAAARTSVNASLSTLTAKLSSRTSALAALEKDEKTLALERAGATQSDISAQEAQVKAADADVENARAQLGKTIVVAPFTGVITKIDAKVGAIVSANTSSISMISSGAFQVEIYIPEVHIVNVKKGDPAQVTLDAYGADVLFDALVAKIDPAETIRDGISTYKTTLQFSEPDERIRSGMTATAIITTARTEDALAVPKSAVYERDSISYVQVKVGERVEEREAVIGGTSFGMLQITSGLSEGDVVVLNPH